jgi:hypothetical protein
MKIKNVEKKRVMLNIVFIVSFVLLFISIKIQFKSQMFHFIITEAGWLGFVIATCFKIFGPVQEESSISYFWVSFVGLLLGLFIVYLVYNGILVDKMTMPSRGGAWSIDKISSPILFYLWVFNFLLLGIIFLIFGALNAVRGFKAKY